MTDSISTDLQVLKLIGEGVNRQQQIADKLGLSKGRVSQIKNELGEQNLLTEEADTLALTDEGHRMVYQELLNDVSDVSHLEDKAKIEDVVVYFKRKPVAAVADSGWTDKFAEMEKQDWRRIEDKSDNYIQVRQYHTVILRPDGIQIHFGDIYSENLTQAKKEAVEKARDIVNEIEEESGETLQIREPNFDGYITYQSLEKIEEPRHFYFGDEPIPPDEVEDEGRHLVWSTAKQKKFRLSIEPPETHRRQLRKLREKVRSEPGKYLKAPAKIEELEERIEKLEGHRRGY